MVTRRPGWSGRRSSVTSASALHHSAHVGHAAAAGFLVWISATIASVVRMYLAIEAAFCSAQRDHGGVDDAGCNEVHDLANRSVQSVALLRLAHVVDDDRALEPAVVRSWRSGSSSARSTILAPVFSSSSSNPSRRMALAACSGAMPPPGGPGRSDEKRSPTPFAVALGDDLW